jgi:hypothetical protein
MPPPSGARTRLALLGALLAFLLLVGVVLAARGVRSADPRASDSNRAATTAEAAPAAAPTVQGQTVVPAAQAPGASTDTFAPLRAFVETGRANGQAGPRADELLAALGSAEQALTAGDTQTAVQHFSAFQQILLDGARNGAIDTGFMVEAMRRVQSLANSQGLTLPLSVELQ